ncbi:MAG: hypothetical protein AVDCRST_MAG49-2734 [uncultured Thermomicrobiales bacterium]|uniref:Uncharacterized protein n=1 Tax=uncultured Thermomicrobiales bacterium TaxID=1645740 RepID=A0A6J4V0L2_9BACT|nr:MAG: hypothetical protein AVDCRST_MAG49-2734 [uncultured Thermomicrobiales bacterium]
MKVGLDYWNTVSHNLDTFRVLADALLDGGHEVYIVTAVGHRRKHTVLADIAALDLPVSGVRMVVFDRPAEAPRLKFEVCQELGITLFFDDRADTCAYLNDRGIVACNVLRRPG